MKPTQKYYKRSESKNTHIVIMGDSRDMATLKDEALHLVVTSPPEWPETFTSEAATPAAILESLAALTLVWRECHRVLVPGCNMCVHVRGAAPVPNPFARPVFHDAAQAISVTCTAAGFIPAGTIVWYRDPVDARKILDNAPDIPRQESPQPDNTDFILIFRKDGEPPLPDIDAASKAAFSEKERKKLFSGLWVFPGAPGEDDNPNPPFSEELPRRLIKMFSYPGETVLDPFLRDGAVLTAARDLARHSVGFETDEFYVDILQRRGMPHNVKFVNPQTPDETTLAFREKLAADSLSSMFSFLHSQQIVAAPAQPTHFVDRQPLKSDYQSERRSYNSDRYQNRQYKTENRQYINKNAPPPPEGNFITPMPEPVNPQIITPSKAPAPPKPREAVVMSFSNLDHAKLDNGSDVRLLGVLVPGEFYSRNPGIYRQAFTYLKNLVEGKKVILQDGGNRRGTTSYYLMLESGENANEMLIAAGYALADRENAHKEVRKFERLEKNARAKGLGMWTIQKTDNPR